MMLLKGELKDQLAWCRRLQWGLVAVLLLLGGGIYSCWIRPQRAALQGAWAHIAMAEAELRQDQDRIGSLPKVELEIQQLRQRKERFNKTLPRQQDLAQFVNDVTRISRQAALEKLCWHLDLQPRRSDRLTEVPIRFSFEGDFQPGVVQFLRGTQDMQRLVRVGKLTLRSGDASDGHVKAEVTMNIYFGDAGSNDVLDWLAQPRRELKRNLFAIDLNYYPRTADRAVIPESPEDPEKSVTDATDQFRGRE